MYKKKTNTLKSRHDKPKKWKAVKIRSFDTPS